MEHDFGEERLDVGNKIIVFIGPEGSGKTTMAKRLAEETGKPYITTGDILRDLAANDEGEWGDACRKMFDEKVYLPGDLLIQILEDRFSREDTLNGFVLDGGMRTVEETRTFQAMLERVGRALPIRVVHLQIPEELSFERLVTGEKARKREGDTVEGVTSRLSKFYYQLDERLNHIESESSWSVVEVDATRSKEEVYIEVRLAAI